MGVQLEIDLVSSEVEEKPPGRRDGGREDWREGGREGGTQGGTEIGGPSSTRG